MYDESEERGLGAGFWLRLLGVVIGAIVVGAILFFLFGWAWYAFGFFGAFLVFALVAIGFSYVYDRRHASRRGDLAG